MRRPPGKTPRTLADLHPDPHNANRGTTRGRRPSPSPCGCTGLDDPFWSTGAA